MQNKRSPSIKKSDAFFVKLFYSETSCAIISDGNHKQSRSPTDQSLTSASSHDIALATSSLMITIKTENYNLISQDFYNKTIHSLDFTLITCTCGHSGCLIRHGSYKRNVQLKDRILTLSIVRVYCTVCSHTHALLLSSMVPYSQIPLNVQIASIQAYEHRISPAFILSGQCFVDENNLRSIIRSYRLYWKQRLRSSGLSFSSWENLVAGCFSCFSRQFMQIKTTVNKLFLLPT